MGEITMKVPRLRLIAGRFFWRPTPKVKRLGFSAEALGGDAARAISRAQELNAEVEVVERGGGQAAIRAGTVAQLIRLYQADDLCLSKAPATRRGYDWLLGEIDKGFGKLKISAITRRGLKATYRESQSRGQHFASAFMRMWSLLLAFAVDEGMIEANPARRMRLRTPAPRQQCWAGAEVSLFCAAAIKLGRPSMALAARLLYDTSQRVGDVLRLSRSARSGDSIEIRQQKTGHAVRVVISLETCAMIDAAPVHGPVILNSEATGRPYKRDHFDHEFARIRKAAGLPMGLQARDLRRTALTEAGAGGATVAELQAMGGHKTMAMLPRYVLTTDEAARSAAQKRNKVAKPPK